MSRLIILTQEYPFGKGEGFIAGELKIYSEKGIKVILIPYKISGKARDLPPGVTVYHSNRDQKIGLRAIIFFIGSGWFWKELLSKFNLIFFPHSRGSFIFFLKLAWSSKNTLEELNQQDPILSSDIFYSYWLGGLTGGVILFNKTQLNRIVLVSRAHGGDLYENRFHPQYLSFRRFLLKKINAISTISKDGADYLSKLYPFAANRISTHYLGTFSPNFVARPSSDGSVRIVSCSFISKVKRLDLLVDALKMYSSKYPDSKIYWTHIGGGEEFSELKIYTERQLKDTPVRFNLLGDLTPTEIFDFYQFNEVDLFISVSSSEGIPVSMMEAISVGIPILATNVGGVREIVVDESMLMSSNPSPSEIADAIFKCVSNLTLHRNKSLEKWSRDFDGRVNYNAFLKFLEGLS